MAGRPEMFEAKPPRFCKVIVEEILSERRLLLPKKFVRKYGKDLPNLVLLKVPSGVEWQIGLTESDGKVWLEKGWQEFADHYSLAYAYFVVFEYEGNCHFNVLIFDKGATEIDYAPRICEGPGEEAADNQSSGKKQENSRTKASGAHCSMMEINEEDLSPFESGGGGMPNIIGSMQPLQNSEKAEALRKSDFETENPSFKVAMKPSYVGNGFRLRIPAAFVRRFKKLMTKTFIIKSNMGKSSLVTMKNRKDGYFFIRGWKSFVKYHDLQVGDFLVFNFVGDRTFDVVIYESSGCVKEKVASNPNRNPTRSRRASVSVARNKEKPTKKHDQAGSSHLSVKSTESPDNDGRIGANAEEIGGIGERERVAEAIRSVTPNHPIFIQVLKDYQKYSMFVPRDIVRETGLAKKKVVVIKGPTGRKWEVGIRASNNGRYVHLTTGWQEFSEANGLVAGDTCVFHFQQQGIINVQIHSKREEMKEVIRVKAE